jgi:hypothetical protein
LIAGSDALLFPPHRQEVDRTGVCRAIALWLAPELAAALRPAAEVAAAELCARGYQGPFSIDGYRYRCAGDALAVQPLSEINARLTFGFLAHAQAARGGEHRFTLADRAG